MSMSIWSEGIMIPKRERLNKNIETEVAVIGAGMAGVLIAERLRKSGKRVVVLEADRIASGQTKNTTAKITMQHGCKYSQLAKSLGIDTARLYAKANLDAVGWFEKFIKENNISCDFERRSAFIYTKKDPLVLKEEYSVYQQMGVAASLTDKTELPFGVKAALEVENQAQFSPLKFISAVVPDLEIYEQTRVKRVKGQMLYCDGAVVYAQHIVFATHYPFVNFPAMYFLRLHQERSYVLALENTSKINGMYIGIDDNGYSFRSYGNYLLLGGGSHRTGENSAGGMYAELRSAAQRYFKNFKEVSHWSAQDCISADTVPYIGQFSKSRPNWYVATGFGKWGMTASCVAADIICDLVCKKQNQYTNVFSPARISVKALSGIAGEGRQAVKGLLIRNLQIPREKLCDIPVGHGGIVVYRGERIGVYRESEQKHYCVSVKCPHLGCRLEWNADEKSWDCPCHGSRFDYTGKLLDNPAQIDLKHKF